MQMFITGAIFFGLLSGSFLWLNVTQAKRIKALEITGDDELALDRFTAWRKAKLSALLWGRIGWVIVFLVGVAVLPWLKTIVPLLAVAAFVVAAVYHEGAARKMKKLPAYLVQGIRGQQGLYRFAWAVPAVLFGSIGVMGLQKVSNMIHPMNAEVVKKDAPAPQEEKAVVPTEDKNVIVENTPGAPVEAAADVAEESPASTPAADPFAE